ncbi:MAG: oligosaccharide flippase family protein [Clostridia bacterium]|nr:oligosaccharide flippase family protein [Clostridia bacterium]
MGKNTLVNSGGKNSRTKNTILNFTSSIGGQLITIIMQFVVRTVFIRTLGKSYLGINGLFSNILTMLSLANMGVGTAIVYKLYKPISENNHQRIATLMHFYKTVYRFIGIAVAAIGVCLIPFLPYIIKDSGKLDSLGINMTFIFLLYLIQNVSSYLFFAYKSAIVSANQKDYLLNIIQYFFTFGLAVVHIVFLLIYPNFTVYVLLTIVEVIARNCVNAHYANKLYPYIKEKPSEKISKDEVKGIFKDCSALFLYKLNDVVLKATDNIVISIFLGLEVVGLYSNYLILYNTIRLLIIKIFNAVSHSIGNLHAENKGRHEYTIFKSVMLVTTILASTAAVGLAVCSDELVNTWIGSDWIIPKPFSILIGVEIFTAAFRTILSKYRTIMGLFQQAKLRPVFGMIINLVVSVALVKSWGICGVLVGTIVADWTTLMWYDPLVVYRVGFKGKYKPSDFFGSLALRGIVTVAVGVIDYFICTNLFTGLGWISVIVHAIICGVTVPLAMLAVSYRTEEGKYLLGILTKFVKKIKK